MEPSRNRDISDFSVLFDMSSEWSASAHSSHSFLENANTTTGSMSRSCSIRTIFMSWPLSARAGPRPPPRLSDRSPDFFATARAAVDRYRPPVSITVVSSPSK
jgi:hypothetical protein